MLTSCASKWWKSWVVGDWKQGNIRAMSNLAAVWNEEAFWKQWGHASTSASAQKLGGSRTCSARQTFTTRCSELTFSGHFWTIIFIQSYLYNCLDAHKNARSQRSSSFEYSAKQRCLKMAVNNYWTRLLEWITGLTIFALKSFLYTQDYLTVELHPALYKVSNMTFCQPCLALCVSHLSVAM